MINGVFDDGSIIEMTVEDDRVIADFVHEHIPAGRAQEVLSGAIAVIGDIVEEWMSGLRRRGDGGVIKSAIKFNGSIGPDRESWSVRVTGEWPKPGSAETA